MEKETPQARSGRELAERLVEDEGLRTRLIEIAAARFRIDRATAEDLLQDAAVELMRTEGLVHSPEGFAYRVFHSRCCRYIERQASRRQLDPSLPDRGRRARDAATDLELALALRQAVRRLSPICQRLLYCRYVEGRSVAETAREMARSIASVPTLVSRCLERLRRLVA